MPHPCRPLTALAQAAMAACLLFSLPGCLSTPTSATAAPPAQGGVVIKYVAHRYIEDAPFKHIAEYFDGKDHPGDRVILRTDPQVRAGYYLIVDLAWHPGITLPAGTKIDLNYICSDSPAPRKEQFTLTEPTGTWPEIFLGLTGSKAWPKRDLDLVAYKIVIKDAEGKVLAEKPSFLWEMPASVVTAAATPTVPAPANP